MTTIFNRALLAVLGLVLVAGGALVVIEAIWTWTGNGFVWIPGDTWLSSFKTTNWSDPATIAISIGIGIVGLLLVAAEVRPRRPRAIPFRTDHTGQWILVRRSTEAHLARRLATQVPTSPIRTRLHPKPRRWTLRVKARAAASTKPVLEGAAQSELAALRAPPGSRVRVDTTGAGAT